MKTMLTIFLILAGITLLIGQFRPPKKD
ncbi:uncharacterized protein METZ01_LOCUS314421 [marine metagenome]|uniref:Uncharacterized protein n=1 Tax=marine metagenome TaxID=408172 RepID=A0A382NMM5_9ZZZZ